MDDELATYNDILRHIKAAFESLSQASSLEATTGLPGDAYDAYDAGRFATLMDSALGDVAKLIVLAKKFARGGG